MERPEIAAFLQSENILALATVAEDGTPHVAPLFYLADGDLRLYWFSRSSSEHSRNLKRNSAAAVTVYRHTVRWKEILGVQMRGTASVVRNRARRRSVADAFADRFGLGPEFRLLLARSSLYCFAPGWLRMIDNSRGFAHKVEIRPVLAN